jgi:hypothetical protein
MSDHTFHVFTTKLRDRGVIIAGRDVNELFGDSILSSTYWHCYEVEVEVEVEERLAMKQETAHCLQYGIVILHTNLLTISLDLFKFILL